MIGRVVSDKTEKTVENTENKSVKVKKEKAPKVVGNTLMDKLLEGSNGTPISGDLVEGPVINIEKSAVYVDLAPYGTGIIFGREFMTARDIIKKINKKNSTPPPIIKYLVLLCS